MNVQTTCADEIDENDPLLSRVSSNNGSLERFRGDGSEGAAAGEAKSAPRGMHKWVLRACLVGITLLLISGVSLAIMPWAIRRVVWRDVSITSSSSTLFQDWLNPAHANVGIYRNFYFFNCTNPYDVINSGATPNYVRRGPYVYEETRRKIESSVRWYDDGTVGYRYESFFHFVPDLSIDAVTGDALSEADDQTMVNMGLYGLIYRMNQLPVYINSSIGKVFKWEACLALSALIKPEVGPSGLFMQRNISDILWGYTDPVWRLVHDALPLVNYTAAYMFRMEWNGSYVVPTPFSFRSGQQCPLWDNLSHCNNTENMETREVSGSIYDSDMGSITQWAGQTTQWWWGTEIPLYTGGEELEPRFFNPVVMPNPGEPNVSIGPLDESCRPMRGSDGFRFGPNVDEGSVLYMFADLFWRTMIMDFWKKSSVYGIDTLRFHTSNLSLSNSEANAHCYGQTRHGVFNFSRPLFGPAYAVKENFLDADVSPHDLNYTLSDVICHNSNCTNRSLSAPMEVLQYIEKHFQRESNPAGFREQFESYMDVHSLSGVTFSAMARGTLFTPIFPVSIQDCDGLFPSLQNLSRSFAPLGTVHRYTKLSTGLAEHIRTLIGILLGIRITLYVLVALSIFLLVVGFVTEVLRRVTNARAEAREEAEEERRIAKAAAINSESSSSATLRTIDTQRRRDAKMQYPSLDT
jgi:hypothetical protein